MHNLDRLVGLMALCAVCWVGLWMALSAAVERL
jgi:hypothetical protein